MTLNQRKTHALADDKFPKSIYKDAIKIGQIQTETKLEKILK